MIAGLTELDGDKVFNSAILVSARGEILATHHKITPPFSLPFPGVHELTIGHEIYDLGRSLSVTDTALGATGLNICADNFPRSKALGRAFGQMGSELILSPCAWAVDADHDNEAKPHGALWLESYSKLALEFEMPQSTSGAWRAVCV